MTVAKMSWRPVYRSSKFRNVYGKVGGREQCFDGIPVTRSVHDSHFCAVNAKFLAVVTESAGGGAFVVIPVTKAGRIDPNYPKVCGHQGSVLDVKWNPFMDNIIASCSEDCSVRIWEIPEGGLRRNMSECVLELFGHSRKVGLVEWHPTCAGLLFSAGYDLKILVWNLEMGGAVKVIDSHSDVILSMSFNTDGSLLATSCKDRRLRLIDPRSGDVLQEADCKSHRVNRVVFLGNIKKLATTGVSRWNSRQVALWDQEDLSMPLVEEEIDGLSGLLFPFYDPDTHMLYLAGKGDGNIRYYEVIPEKPYLQFIMEFHSPAPQKGLVGGVPGGPLPHDSRTRTSTLSRRVAKRGQPRTSSDVPESQLQATRPEGHPGLQTGEEAGARAQHRPAGERPAKDPQRAPEDVLQTGG
ncbi:coronin-2B-like isoform X2 [Alosa sapidissima]|uniref:coronin-2B-like isoform X2 n=1 Tax=Alosa sapidissima TaxID=34773 RepID=UPI001C091407|nr:coronin-2B-like isoform X2 [Alosa sapidissima]